MHDDCGYLVPRGREAPRPGLLKIARQTATTKTQMMRHHAYFSEGKVKNSEG